MLRHLKWHVFHNFRCFSACIRSSSLHHAIMLRTNRAGEDICKTHTQQSSFTLNNCMHIMDPAQFRVTNFAVGPVGLKGILRGRHRPALMRTILKCNHARRIFIQLHPGKCTFAPQCPSKHERYDRSSSWGVSLHVRLRVKVHQHVCRLLDIIVCIEMNFCEEV